MHRTREERLSILGLLKSSISAWLNDRALNLSAALAYYSIFSLAPLLLIAVGVAGLVFGSDAVQGKLDDQLKIYIGAEAAKGVQSLTQNAAKPAQGWAGAVTGFVVLLIGASGVFGQLKEALNTIWGVKQKPRSGIAGVLHERLLSFGMVLAIGFLLLVSLLLTSAIAALNQYLNQFLGLPAPLWATLSFVVSFAMVTALFAMIFKILPDAQIEWRDVWIGAAATAALFEIGKLGLAYYLGRESAKSSYGAAGSVVLLLLWVYYASCILLLGAEFTRVFADAKGRSIRPSANAERVPKIEEIAMPASGRAPAKEHVHAPTFEDPASGNAAVPARAKRAPFWKRAGGLVGVAAAAYLAGRFTRKQSPAPVDDEGEWLELAEDAAKSATKAMEKR
jgi:membrane protein